MISFIIPTYNEEVLLPGLLRQLCTDSEKQNYPYEVIVSDGGSSDKTVDIAKSFPVRDVITSKERDNIPTGKNRGAKAASGDILIFICADIRFKDFSKFLHVVTTELTGTTVAMTFPVQVFPEERKFSDVLFHGFYNRYFHLINGLGIGFGRGECQVIKRSVFEQLKGFQEQLAAGEDFDLFRRIDKLGKINFCTRAIVFESPRRYRKFGYWKVVRMWSKNAFSVMKKNQSFSKEWEPVR
jgi:glycosyltransferase involved in cell wall biosynthesis